MFPKLFLIVVLAVLIQFNRPILAEDDLIYHQPQCNKTKLKWTEDEVVNKCWPFYQNDDYKLDGYDIIGHYRYQKYDNCKEILSREKIDVKVCCEGFKKFNEDKCVMDCKYHCKHGECDGNDRCSCAIGFGGRWCDTPCPAGQFGLKCEHDCNCLTSRTCNSNYQHCKCDGGSITAECENICKCRTNICNPGRIGKNCTETCPDGSYGQFCSKTCSCVKENTRECVKESGDCVCKDRFYGLHCELECTGILKCDVAGVCMCELSPEQKVERAELVSRTRGIWIIGLFIGLVCVTALLLVASLLVHRYKVKSKRLKKEVYSLRYSSDGGNVAFSNSIYSTNLLDDHLTVNQPTKPTGFLEALKSSRLFNRMNIGKPFNAKTLKDEETTYSTISELKEETKSNDPAI